MKCEEKKTEGQGGEKQKTKGKNKKKRRGNYV